MGNLIGISGERDSPETEEKEEVMGLSPQFFVVKVISDEEGVTYSDVQFELREESTIRDVKAELWSKLDLSTPQLDSMKVFIFGDEENVEIPERRLLKNLHPKSILEARITNSVGQTQSSTLPTESTVPQQSSGREMETQSFSLKFKILERETLTLRVVDGMKVSDLKSEISENTQPRIESQNMKLVFVGSVLDDEATVNRAEYEDNTEVTVIVEESAQSQSRNTANTTRQRHEENQEGGSVSTLTTGNSDGNQRSGGGTFGVIFKFALGKEVMRQGEQEVDPEPVGMPLPDIPSIPIKLDLPIGISVKEVKGMLEDKCLVEAKNMTLVFFGSAKKEDYELNTDDIHDGTIVTVLVGQQIE